MLGDINYRVKPLSVYSKLKTLHASSILLAVLAQSLLLVASVGTQAIFDVATQSGNSSDVSKLSAVFLVSAIAQVGLTFTQHVMGARSLRAAIAVQTDLVLQKILGLQPFDFNRHSLGSLLASVGAAGALQRTITNLAPVVFVDLPFFFIALAILFWYSPSLAFIPLAGTVVSLVLRGSLWKIMDRSSKDSAVARARDNSMLMETLRNYRATYISRAMHLIHTRYRRFLIRITNEQKDEHLAMAAIRAISTCTPMVTSIAVICFGANLVIGGKLSFGSLVAVLLIKNQYEQKSGALVETIFSVLPARTLFEHIDKLGFAEPMRSEEIARATSGINEINAEGVTCKFGEKTIFRNVTMKFPGQALSLIHGRSGSGKTSLINVLLGIVVPAEGRCTALYKDPAGRGATPIDKIRTAALYQDDLLLAGSITQNISLFEDVPDVALVSESLSTACALDFVQQLEMGLDGRVEEGGKNFSTGQRQRLLLARALYRRPDLLLLDEATSNLDLPTELRIFENLTALGLTVIAATHSTHLDHLATCIVTLAPDALPLIETKPSHAS